MPVVIGDMASAPQDISVYERVEILRGANGLLHGSGNPAATVNLVRKRPQYQFSANASVSVGSWDRYRAEADIGGPLNAAGTVRSRLVAAYEDRHFFYDHAKQDTRSIYGITEVDVTRDTLLTFGAQYQTTRSIPDMSGVPMARDARAWACRARRSSTLRGATSTGTRRARSRRSSRSSAPAGRRRSAANTRACART